MPRRAFPLSAKSQAGRRHHGDGQHRQGAASQQADPPGEEGIPHGRHDPGEFFVPADAQQLLDAAGEHRAVAQSRAAHAGRRVHRGGDGSRVAAPAEKGRHHHQGQPAPVEQGRHQPFTEGSLRPDQTVQTDEEGRDEAVGKADILGQGQQGQRQGGQPEDAPAALGAQIQAEGAAEEHGHGQVGHGVDVLGGVGPRHGVPGRSRAAERRRQRPARRCTIAAGAAPWRRPHRPGPGCPAPPGRPTRSRHRRAGTKR